MQHETDVAIVGAGLSGLVAACKIAEAGRKVVLLDQEPEQSLGGQAFWSLGGLFFIDSPEQRRLRIRDRALANPFGKDLQVTALRGARNYLGDKLIRTAKPHRILDPAHGPLIAVRLNILTRKSLGGLMTDLSSRVLGDAGEPVPGLYAAGEAAGFGGGVHGYRALEGTFLGGCIFSGRAAGRAAAGAVA